MCNPTLFAMMLRKGWGTQQSEPQTLPEVLTPGIVTDVLSKLPKTTTKTSGGYVERITSERAYMGAFGYSN